MSVLRRPPPAVDRTVALATIAGGAIAAAAKVRGTDTHGRWPWLAALAAPPATVAVITGPLRSATDAEAATWASLPLLLCHETEEWVLPSGFLSWFNRSVWGSDDDEFPTGQTRLVTGDFPALAQPQTKTPEGSSDDEPDEPIL